MSATQISTTNLPATETGKPEFVPHDRPDKFWCLECHTPLSMDLRVPGTPYCRDCATATQTRAALASQTGLMRKAASNMLDLVAQYDVTKGPNDALVDTFLQTFGPQDAGLVAADICKSVMNAARGSSDLKIMREARVWFFRLQALTERYQKQVDERRKSLSNVSLEDLYAMLRPMCVELCRNDPAFLHEVLQSAEPDWLIDAASVEPPVGEPA